jgi:hypothetical protein
VDALPPSPVIPWLMLCIATSTAAGIMLCMLTPWLLLCPG